MCGDIIELLEERNRDAMQALVDRLSADMADGLEEYAKCLAEGKVPCGIAYYLGVEHEQRT